MSEVSDLPFGAGTAPKTNDDEIISVMVKLSTRQEQYAVPGASIAISETIDTSGLNRVVNSFLLQGGIVDNVPDFDFLVSGKLLRTTLGDHLRDAGISFETGVDIEFFERQPPPTPQDSLQHDDWVAAVQSCGAWLLTGCYDNTVQLWEAEGLDLNKGRRAHKLTIPAHHAPVKAVAWLNTTNTAKTFISGSLDQTTIVWEWNSENNSVEYIWECRGHTQSIECICVDPNSTLFATGSWDNSLKLWDSAKSEGGEHTEPSSEEPDKKKIRPSKKAKLKTPVMTLVGHTESVSGVVWMSSTELATSSWDHTLRVWDYEIGEVANQISGNTAFFALSWSPLNRTILATCADRHIRRYDPRSKEGSVVKQKFTSHRKWVSSVKWSTTNDRLFVSGGYDNLIKLWDCRSPATPLYDLTGHDDRLLMVDWSFPGHIASGSADCTAKVFSDNIPN